MLRGLNLSFLQSFMDSWTLRVCFWFDQSLLKTVSCPRFWSFWCFYAKILAQSQKSELDASKTFCHFFLICSSKVQSLQAYAELKKSSSRALSKKTHANSKELWTQREFAIISKCSTQSLFHVKPLSCQITPLSAFCDLFSNSIILFCQLQFVLSKSISQKWKLVLSFCLFLSKHWKVLTSR